MEIDNEFKKRAGEALEEGVLFGYCPKHLVVEGREELWVFPLNILFSKFRTESDGSRTMGSAIYNPDLSTFITEKGQWSMTYRNQYGGDSHVIITITTFDLSYRGDKFVNGELVGSADGKIKEDAEGIEKGWERLARFMLSIRTAS